MNELTYILNYLEDFNPASIIIRLLLAVILGGLVGMDRSKNGHVAGLRTHILVCLGATIASMTGLYIEAQMGDGDVGRIAAQVVSGIGWIGAGSIILRNNSTVTGLTTAACVWAVGTIGIAIGYGFYLAAIFGSLLIVFIIRVLSSLDGKLRRNMQEVSLYAELLDSTKINETVGEMKSGGLEVEISGLVGPKSGLQNGIGVELVVHVKKDKDLNEMCKRINEMENVHFATLVSQF